MGECLPETPALGDLLGGSDGGVQRSAAAGGIKSV